ncbi:MULTISPECIES: ABC-type transport auxiliary lipoprotein family protein [Pseudomonas]|uniref:ABC-type transport auxiliary lipoprotein family protein n=1 Tax=Pseudomonas nitroreducens TaxID=46680 RepID=UPI001E42A3D8|nr:MULTISPECIES: ABC-type transport auxiliary lipoprotein family protein [Pseudomonas]MCE4071374.1 ABC-type transport auxiliary lipoprotein family protein [Pseudomonas nitritireducens]MCE4080743.1 ABC-type transport auxiliary lipoprotein family protein [Pseudomonas nitroreducens]
MTALPRLLGVATLVGLLGACSLLPKAESPDFYLLPATQQPARGSAAVNWSLRVSAPTASLALDSNRIAVVPQGNQLSSYQGARWSNRAPGLLRDRLLDAFTANGSIRALSSDETSLQADLDLTGELRAFQSEYQSGKPVIHIRYDARLVRTLGQRIVASRSFEVSQPVDGKQVPEVVSAFGKAADQLSAQVVEWTLQQGQRQHTTSPSTP